MHKSQQHCSALPKTQLGMSIQRENENDINFIHSNKDKTRVR
jgi:hypothetical protein